MPSFLLRFSLGIFLLAGAILTGCKHTSPVSTQPVIGLEPEQNSMVVQAYPYDEAPGTYLTMILPKAIASQDATMLNQNVDEMVWEGPKRDGSVICRYRNPGLLNYSIHLQPSHDYVNMVFEVKNLTEQLWENTWFFTLLAPMGAPDFQDQAGERTWIQVDGESVRVASAAPHNGPRRDLITILHEETVEKRVPQFHRDLKANSATRTDGNWMITTNEEETEWIGMACREPVFLFRNSDISSIHVAPSFGDIEPGETKSVFMRVYFADGNRDDALSRIEEETSSFR